MSSPSRNQSRTKRSWVWSYFQQQEGGVEQKYKCNLCNKDISGTNSGSTTPLSRHLETMHKLRDPEAKRRKTTVCSKERQTCIDNLIIRCICSGFHSLATVEQPEFIELISYLDPSYKVPSRNHFRKLMCEYYSLIEQKVILKHQLLWSILTGNAINKNSKLSIICCWFMEVKSSSVLCCRYPAIYRQKTFIQFLLLFDISQEGK